MSVMNFIAGSGLLRRQLSERLTTWRKHFHFYIGTEISGLFTIAHYTEEEDTEEEGTEEEENVKETDRAKAIFQDAGAQDITTSDEAAVSVRKAEAQQEMRSAERGFPLSRRRSVQSAKRQAPPQVCCAAEVLQSNVSSQTQKQARGPFIAL